MKLNLSVLMKYTKRTKTQNLFFSEDYFGSVRNQKKD